MRHVIVGAGEVGRALAAVLRPRDAYLRDVAGEVMPAEFLHVAFPWSPDFGDQVRGYVADYRPAVTVIHSTVPPGTSRALGAVHSPVTGRHPNLAPSLLTFVKFFGGPGAERAAQEFEAVGCRVECYPDQETTEAGKLLATLQFGWLVAMQKDAYRYARAVGADPDVAYRRFNEAYTEGYAKLGEPFALPVLRDMPGPIGGHCVIPNARITDSATARMLLDLDALP